MFHKALLCGSAVRAGQPGDGLQWGRCSSRCCPRQVTSSSLATPRVTQLLLSSDGFSVCSHRALGFEGGRAVEEQEVAPAFVSGDLAKLPNI